METYLFFDREEAGQLLAEKLEPYRGKDTLVLAIPRGGLPIGAAIARHLDAPLDIVLSKETGHPEHDEFAIGAASLKSIILDTSAKEVSKWYLDGEIQRIRKSLKDKQETYYQNQHPHSVYNKRVILTDDGLATGNTMLSTVALIKEENPLEIILAVPVAPQSAIEKLKHTGKVDRIICLNTPLHFVAVGYYYKVFDQVSDEKAMELLMKYHQSSSKFA